MEQTIKEVISIKPNPEGIDAPLNTRIRYEYSYEAFRRIIEQVSANILYRRGETRPFVRTAHTDRVIEWLYGWISCNAAIDFRRGLLLIGKYGCGKSLLLESFFFFLKDLSSERKFKVPYWYRSVDLVKMLMEDKTWYNQAKYTKSPLFIDELGREPIDIKHFGNEDSPLIELLLKKWENGSMIFATSNFNLTTLSSKEKYGPMLGDRFKQMFTVLQMGGESMRKEL